MNDINLIEQNHENNRDMLSSISGYITPPIEPNQQINQNILISISKYVVPITTTLSNVFTTTFNGILMRWETFLI